MTGSNCGQLARLDPVQSAFLSIAPSVCHLPAEEPHYYTHYTEEEREVEDIAMSPETVIVRTGLFLHQHSYSVPSGIVTKRQGPNF